MSRTHTFVSVFNETDLVSIPRIQRPYAQGRTDPESTRIRGEFLESLFAVLRGEKDHLDLNFIYGKRVCREVQGKNLRYVELLDGQQRFTTLFLLHWYLLNRETVSEDVAGPIRRALTSFSYETRDDSREFCKLLARTTIGLAGLADAWDKKHVVNSATSGAVRSLLDFTYSFDEDPTVSAMLVMLDAIHMKYGELLAAGMRPDCWTRLDNIFFRVLFLDEYRLSEELYIKMNARGRQLSPFERFKAEFLALMDLPVAAGCTGRSVLRTNGQDADASAADSVTFKQYFALQLDTRWCGPFWNAREPKSLDISLMKFFARFFAARFLLEHYARNDITGNGWRDEKIDLHILHSLYESEPDRYHGIRAFRSLVETFGADIRYFDDLAILLDRLSRPELHADILDAMKPLWEPEGTRQPDWFCDGAAKFEQMSLVTLSAVVEFARLFPSFPMDIFRIWMKSVNCVVENTNIDSYTPTANTAGRLMDLLHSIADRSPASADDFVRAMAETDDTRRPTAIREEILKARRIAENAGTPDADRWKAAFDGIARDPFLKGMVGFFHSATMTIDAFESHSALIRSLFDGDGIAKPYRKEPHWMLRAVFSRLSTDKHLRTKRFLVEAATKKYLKNFISSADSPDLRKGMNDLFAVRLAGLEPGEPGLASEGVLKAFRSAVEEAPPVPDGQAWTVREAIRILRNDEAFYHWVFAQKKDIKVYVHHNQYQARGDWERDCVMLSVFRRAEEFAKASGMEYRYAGSGFNDEFGMFVGESCSMRKSLTNNPGREVRVRFYTDDSRPCPVEVSVAWPAGSMTAADERRFEQLIGGERAVSVGTERQSRIGVWNYSMDSAGEKDIGVSDLKNRVEGIVNVEAVGSDSTPTEDVI